MYQGIKKKEGTHYWRFKTLSTAVTRGASMITGWETAPSLLFKEATVHMYADLSTEGDYL